MISPYEGPSDLLPRKAGLGAYVNDAWCCRKNNCVLKVVEWDSCPPLCVVQALRDLKPEEEVCDYALCDFDDIQNSHVSRPGQKKKNKGTPSKRPSKYGSIMVLKKVPQKPG